MMVIRPVERNDVDQLFVLASKTGAGLTTLPANREYLEKRIAHSIQAFASSANKPIDACYLLVLEDLENKKIVGTSGIVAAVGTSQPFYTYKVNKVVTYSQSLDIYRNHKFLTLTNDFTDTSELCSLFLSPDYRGGNNGVLLSKSRFLMMANQPTRFSKNVIAEMRGVSDENGKSPFWENVGRHFFGMDFTDADRANGEGNQQFIAELIPHHPIYLSMLSTQAQSVVGKVHPKTKPALKILEAEGFRNTGYVDIFDAGPTIEAPLNTIKSVKKSFIAEVKINEENASSDDNDKTIAIVSNVTIENFRACLVKLEEKKQKAIKLSSETAQALKVKVGDKVRIKLY